MKKSIVFVVFFLGILLVGNMKLVVANTCEYTCRSICRAGETIRAGESCSNPKESCCGPEDFFDEGVTVGGTSTFTTATAPDYYTDDQYISVKDATPTTALTGLNPHNSGLNTSSNAVVGSRIFRTGLAWNTNNLASLGLPSGSILGIISGIMTFLLTALGIFGIIGFIISGILYLISAGEEGMISRAKRAMTWSIVGTIVGLLGYIAIQAIELMLSGYSNF
ncbi:MAG: hypothetical protein UT50_C0018G0008 [Candidatus Moranbacteria bacterium GW2011_GWA2_39_41]|nr:MAG: hypothetical protein UT50_C0018G0008 [Candidatus Moranbacteria bacterium GW2011_GWA2_39_41]